MLEMSEVTEFRTIILTLELNEVSLSWQSSLYTNFFFSPLAKSKKSLYNDRPGKIWSIEKEK